jgi:hypothetical protein
MIGRLEEKSWLRIDVNEASGSMRQATGRPFFPSWSLSRDWRGAGRDDERDIERSKLNIDGTMCRKTADGLLILASRLRHSSSPGLLGGEWWRGWKRLAGGAQAVEAGLREQRNAAKWRS